MPSSSHFRVNAKNYFLTYPKCSLTKDEALSQLTQLDTPVEKKFIKVSRELHENGEPHLHVLVQFKGKFQCTNQRLFDLVSPHRSAHFHPNIQGAKSSSDVKTYIDKDGDSVEWGQFQIDGRSARKQAVSIADTCAEALNCSNVDSALKLIKERIPDKFIFQYHNLRPNLDKIFAKTPEAYVPEYSSSQFDNIPNEIRDWTVQNVMASSARPSRPRSIVVQGGTRTGKTQWARSLGPHNYLCGHLDLNAKVFNNDAWYNVIDDVDPHYLKHFREFMGCQKNWQSNTKYGKPILVKGGIPTIFLCNAGPKASYKSFLDEEQNSDLKDWALGNAAFVFLDQPLYTPSANGHIQKPAEGPPAASTEEISSV